jgi:hypothetical protein
MYLGTLAYTPGNLGCAHIIPHDTIPPTNQRSRSPGTGQRSGPPESPCEIEKKSFMFVCFSGVVKKSKAINKSQDFEIKKLISVIKASLKRCFRRIF